MIPKSLKESLEDVGFDIKNKRHHFVVAGDICDGFGNDYELIKFLITLEEEITTSRMHVVRGNHDYGPENDGAYYQHLNNVKRALTQKQIEWISNKPYQLETKHLRIAHGLWITKKIKEKVNEEHLANLSIWGSPILLNSNHYDWWNTRKEVKDIVFSLYDSAKSYASDPEFINKPLILGRFGSDTLDSMDINRELLNSKIDILRTLETISWLDSSLIQGNKLEISIFEFDDE